MYTERENFYKTINFDGPDRLCCDYDAFGIVRGDPITAIQLSGVEKNTVQGDVFTDSWGTKIVHPEGHPGAMPLVEGEYKVLTDIENWKETLTIPDYSSMEFDWSGVNKTIDEMDKTEKIPCGFLLVGLFERTHYLMGFEDALVNHLLYPDEMHELLDVIMEVRLQQLKITLDNAKYEAFILHDDFGSKEQLFLRPEVWREFYKERYRKIYDYAHSRGAIIVHHSDSFVEPIALDLAEVGLDCLQGVLPSNNIPEMQKELKGKLALMGGVDLGLIDRENADESEVRAEVRRACAEYGPAGGFIPSTTYGGPACIYPGKHAILRDEIIQYNKETYGCE